MIKPKPGFKSIKLQSALPPEESHCVEDNNENSNGNTTPHLGATEMSDQTKQMKINETDPTENDGNLKGSISNEVTELVKELRDTVKRIDPKRHSCNSLRRVLLLVSDILDEIKLKSAEGVESNKTT